MGEQNVSEEVRQAPDRFMTALLQDLKALEWMLEHDQFETGVRRVGAEQEIFLVDHTGHPALLAPQIMEKVKDVKQFTTELARFNLEMNLDPLVFTGDALGDMESQLVDLLAIARKASGECGAQVVLAGILPTLAKTDLTLDSMTPNPRYRALNEALTGMRNGPYNLYIQGVDELSVTHDNVMLEACNCSFQLHFQVAPEEFARLYNIAQLVSAPVLAAATNSPLLFGRRLWQETRIALFQQSLDTRATSSYMQQRFPRVSFGTRWVRESVAEVFREDISRFRTIFSPEADEDPFTVLERGEAPKLKALCLHNGTVYRWNRACYGITDGKPHLRIENRVLPSGPTPRDEIANGAFWFGLISGYSQLGVDPAQHMDFDTAKDNFTQSARYGLRTQLEWLDGKVRPANELILKELIPLAREGLKKKNINGAHIDLYLGLIEERVKSGQTGSRWLLKSLKSMPGSVNISERMEALTAGLVARQKEDIPVNDWDEGSLQESTGWQNSFRRVEQIMTTDLFTVQQDEPLELVAHLMDWERIRHVPVEDDENNLVGLMSYRSILRLLAKRHPGDEVNVTKVSEVMLTDILTVPPDCPTLDALRLMRERRIGSLPVVKDGSLVGIVTERDFMDVASQLLESTLAEDADQSGEGGEQN